MRRAFRGVRLAVEAVIVVAASRNVLGVWPTSAALAFIGLWWGLQGWQRIETSAFPGRSAPVPAGRSPVGPAGHAAFARALAAVADAYLSECEAEARSHDRR
jgi:hypothetical protein